MIRFDTPIAFLLLVFVPLLWEPAIWSRLLEVFGWRKGIARADAISFAAPVAVEELPVSTRARIRPLVVSSLSSIAFIFLVIALARPQSGTEFTETDASGRDIMLVLDTSGSMEAVDFTVDDQRATRLAALKKVAKDFIDGRRGDRMGLVVFGEQAFTQCPLTLDHQVLKEFVDALQIGMAGKGTAIGDALAIGLKRIRDIESDSKVLILVTDGKDNSSTLDPKQSAEIAKKLNVKVHTIGIGSKRPAPFVRETFMGLKHVISQPMEFDEKALKEIASITGGKYFNARNTAKLAEIYLEIDLLEERMDTVFEYIEYEEEFLFFAGIGFALYFFGQLGIATVFLKIP